MLPSREGQLMPFIPLLPPPDDEDPPPPHPLGPTNVSNASPTIVPLFRTGLPLSRLQRTPSTRAFGSPRSIDHEPVRLGDRKQSLLIEAAQSPPTHANAARRHCVALASARLSYADDSKEPTVAARTVLADSSLSDAAGRRVPRTSCSRGEQVVAQAIGTLHANARRNPRQTQGEPRARSIRIEGSNTSYDCSRGRVTVNCEPRASSLSTPIWPPSASVRRLTM